MSQITTIERFILDNQPEYAKGEFSRLLYDLALAAKIISHKVNRAGLLDIIGEAGEVNVQGEDQQKLDVYADNQFINAFRYGGEVCGILRTGIEKSDRTGSGHHLKHDPGGRGNGEPLSRG